MGESGLIDAQKLRDSVEHTAARLAELPSRGLIRPRVSTRLVRDVTAEAPGAVRSRVHVPQRPAARARRGRHGADAAAVLERGGEAAPEPGAEAAADGGGARIP